MRSVRKLQNEPWKRILPVVAWVFSLITTHLYNMSIVRISALSAVLLRDPVRKLLVLLLREALLRTHPAPGGTELLALLGTALLLRAGTLAGRVDEVLGAPSSDSREGEAGGRLGRGRGEGLRVGGRAVVTREGDPAVHVEVGLSGGDREPGVAGVHAVDVGGFRLIVVWHVRDRSAVLGPDGGGG